MRQRALGVLALMRVFGCPDGRDLDGQPLDPVRGSTQATADLGAALDEPGLCRLLPSCGPCSLACEPEKLAEEYVPEGTCALFLCTLIDRRQIEVDACNVGDGCAARPAEDGATVEPPSCRSLVAARWL